MKNIRKIAIFAVIAVLCLIMVACKKPIDGDGPIVSKVLTPADITKLPDLINYGREAKYYDVNEITYSDYSAEKTKLAARIVEKQADAADPDTSSIIKIFAASDAEKIILAMGKSALPATKMTKTVDYLAGDETVTEEAIETKVASGVWSATTGWSFFDDWSYYEKLQDRADATGATNDDKDNVSRQYRNMAGKVFAIGMTGDEFARVATNELDYALDVVRDMAGNKAIGTTEFDTYCKNNLDYETLAYLHAFNDYYRKNQNGKPDCTELYGYYYDYNLVNYNAVSDENFEKELKYSHYTIYTDAEWLDYVAIQRNNYINAYRYTDTFYNTFYTKHFSFQENKENHEYNIYGFSKYSNLTYTGEMRQAITANGLQGQLNMSDWMWCYSGNEDNMKAYNQANTNYENGKKGGSEQENQGKFYYEMEQLKMIHYLLTNMTSANLSGALRYQIYSYSGSMLQTISGNEKDRTLINVNKLAPADATTLLASLSTDNDKKSYATGKIGAIISQMKATYSTVGIASKAQKAANESWSSMKTEIETAMKYDYSTLTSWADKVERLEDLVIKRKYDCGAGLDEACLRGNGHAECEKVYDTEHTISQFVSNYEQILRYVGGTVSLSFQQLKEAAPGKPNNYKINEYAPNLPVTYRCGFGQASPVTTLMLTGIEYFEKKEITINSGNVFKEEIKEADSKDKEWWEKSSSPARPNSSVTETSPNQQSGTYIYEYTFSGWYLDQALLYKFDENDTITCDLILYAGYNVTKKQ